MRQAKITRTLEDGSIEEFFVDLESKKKSTKTNKATKKVNSDESDKKEEKEQTTAVSSKVEITKRAKS